MRIGIVNDLMLAVEALRRVVCSVPGYTLAWIARDGQEAVQKCAADRPDIILMDLIMPVMNGVEATRHIMIESPCAILIVTATVQGNISLVFEAMGHGALDVVRTPVLGREGMIEGAADLLAKIEIIGKLTGAVGRTKSRSVSAAEAPPASLGAISLIVIGSSTGGPAALSAILSRLPGDLDAAIVITQHVDQYFAPELATWLNTRTSLQVKVAEEGSRPIPGTVCLASTNDHLIMTPSRALRYSREPLDCYYRPSVDVFFKSVAEHWPAAGTAVLLTGMGKDGGEGMMALKKAGWYTIAQDEKSSVVFGMPKAAIEMGAASQIVPLTEIAAVLKARLHMYDTSEPGGTASL